jgi:hypothetical protein
MRTWILLLVSLPWIGSPALADQGVWLPVGSLSSLRADATVTLLPSGKVLMAGGEGPGGEIYNTAELYDPADGTWTPTGDLHFARARHSATLLPTGQVLVVGGFNGSALATAELYDPATGIWKLTGASLANARFQHTATLLSSGRVLVAGGLDGTRKALGTAEIYLPWTRAWIQIKKPMIQARGQHTATLLASGQVLLAGGTDGQSLVAPTELYDGKTWTPAGPLAQPRICHTATLLPSGKVLVAGGSRDSQCGEAGHPFSAAIPVEIFNPADPKSKWKSSRNPMSGSRALHAAVLLPSGGLLVAGGVPPSGSGKLNPGSEIYDSRTDRWQAGANLPDPGGNLRSRHAAVLLPSGEVLLAGGDRLRGALLYEPPRPMSVATERVPGGLPTGATTTLLPSGKVLVAGGLLQGSPTDKAWLYDPATGAWSATGKLSTPHAGHTATLLPNRSVLLVGGTADSKRSIEIYKPWEGAWSLRGSHSPSRSGHTATLLPSGRVLIAGGVGAAALRSAEIYDPAGDSWTSTADMRVARSEPAAVLLRSGEVLVAGGAESSASGSAEIFDPRSETWSPTGPLLVPRRRATATLLPGGEVLLAGGTGTDAIAETEIYDPQSNLWAAGPKLRSARTDHKAFLLPSGKVAIAGGWDGSGAPVDAVEILDPNLGTLATAGHREIRRSPAVALLTSGKLLLAGGANERGIGLDDAEVMDLDTSLSGARPDVTSACAKIDYGIPCDIQGDFLSAREASGGGTNNSAVNRPLVQLLSLEGGQMSWLLPAPAKINSRTNPVTLVVAELPPLLNPGWHRLTAFTNGRAGESRLVRVGCDLKITPLTEGQQTVEVGLHETATFSVEAEGARAYQWQKCKLLCNDDQSWKNIDGATRASLSIVADSRDEDGAQFRAVVTGNCQTKQTSGATKLTIKAGPPTAEFLSPKGGEYWPLSTSAQTNTQLIIWTMSNEAKVCNVVLSLMYSTDGGLNYSLAQRLTTDPSCSDPGTTTKSYTYTIPTTPPSKIIGSLYKVKLEITDLHGAQKTVWSRPFYFVQPSPDVRTLILTNLGRMVGDTTELSTKLQELASHPRVQGMVVDLSTSGLDYSQSANELLFGKNGIHEKIIALLKSFPGAKYLVLVGDDQVIPFARVADRTALAPESGYVAQDGYGKDISTTTVGQALKDGQILTDDPLAMLRAVSPSDLAFQSDHVFIPDLAVGRLVESPTEIIKTISTFLSRDGVLDLTQLNARKVLVTGYDFLQDSGEVIQERWKGALGKDSSDLVNGDLLGKTWKVDNLRAQLCGGGSPYAVTFLNGHATHDREGVPGGSFNDGLPAGDIYTDLCGSGQPLNLEGGVIFAVGCHGGLSIPGSVAANHTLDLPQTFLSRGAVAYVANTGFGWGLLNGIGYAERLQQILAEEMTAGGTVVTGDAVKRTKMRYFLETPRVDPYDEKSLLQWTFFGLPMYAVKTGIGATTSGKLAVTDRPAVERIGPVVVERRRLETSPESATQIAKAGTQTGLPRFLTRLDLRIDFGPDTYVKRGASGIPLNQPGCSDRDGCYYTLNALNGVVDRATGMSDQPIEPYFIYDSRLSGTSQHGVLWKGGTFTEETGWTPVIARLVSNGAQGSSPGALPPHDPPKPQRRKQIIGDNTSSCPVSDLELNTLVVPTGETLGENHSILRLFQQVNLETFYFNDTTPGSRNNCDNSGPSFTSKEPYHHMGDGKITWNLTVEDDDTAGVWRVVVVYNIDRKGEKDQWIPLELNQMGSSWQGTLELGNATHLSYVIQAVDMHGNVSWLDYSYEGNLPDSGVKPEIPQVVDVSTVPNSP